MSLTEQQKNEVDADFEKKATLLEWRDGNRKEVWKLTRLFKIENAKEGEERDGAWEIRCALRHDIEFGKELIERQTSALMRLSMTNIARRVDADIAEVIYYEKASLHTERRPAVRQKQIMNAIKRKKLEIPVFGATV